MRSEIVLLTPFNSFMQIEKEKILIKIFNHCGKNVSWGSGNYVNRIPGLNDFATRIHNNLDCPTGDLICDNCDKKGIEEYE